MKKILQYIQIQTLFLIIPIIIVFAISGLLFYYLSQNKDPSVPPSALLNKQVPTFEAINLLKMDQKINNNVILEKKVLINFFASWCAPCKVEHPLLIQIKNNHQNLFILGFNHKDKRSDALSLINDLGNPYTNIGIDSSGKIAMDFGVYGLPETFLINEEGIIVFKHVGPLTKKLYNEKIKKFLSD